MPMLNKHGITIVQIGAKDDRPINFVYSAVGQTNINQTAYLISNAQLHLGVDSFPVHIAGSLDIPLVALYSNSYVNCVKPYWGNPKKQILLEPDRGENCPSFAMQESPKTINSIPPEKIAAAVCELLNIEFEYPYKGLFIGDTFNNMILETVPNQVVDISKFSLDNIIVRMDFEFNEQNLARQLAVSKCAIVTNRPINAGLLNQFKPNIIEVHYEIDGTHSPDFVKFLKHIGIRTNLMSFMSDEEINALKLLYMDFGMIFRQSGDKPKELEGVDVSQLTYKSSKFTLSNNNIYPSKLAWKHNQPIPNVGHHMCPLAPLKDKPLNDLWTEKRHLRLLSPL